MPLHAKAGSLKRATTIDVAPDRLPAQAQPFSRSPPVHAACRCKTSTRSYLTFYCLDMRPDLRSVELEAAEWKQLGTKAATLAPPPNVTRPQMPQCRSPPFHGGGAAWALAPYHDPEASTAVRCRTNSSPLCTCFRPMNSCRGAGKAPAGQPIRLFWATSSLNRLAP